MKFSYIVTIFLNNCWLMHRNKSSNEADLIAKRTVCPKKLLKEHIEKFELRNELGFMYNEQQFRTLPRLWSVLPLIWFVLVPCSFEISLHSCCIVACTSSPICYVDGIPVLLLVLLQCFELWDRAEATDKYHSHQLSKSSLCDVILQFSCYYFFGTRNLSAH